MDLEGVEEFSGGPARCCANRRVAHCLIEFGQSGLEYDADLGCDTAERSARGLDGILCVAGMLLELPAEFLDGIADSLPVGLAALLTHGGSLCMVTRYES